ncbi:transferase [Flavobacterium jejuense]|uniref:Transferase n=1 Tax=Flavobacterium jejuense TaxID=1544455 RepID=A0ABX0IUI7_9FLAO|nr:transferase [Flavobacterium jejuense]NHN27575.1 transferase [Flavobacterium jejuense]
MIFKKTRVKISKVLKVNWIKTIYFNFKKFPFQIAKKMPIVFYGKVKFQNISGEISINAPIKFGMIGFGKPYEMNSVHQGTAEIMLTGKIVFKGHVQFGKDYFLFVSKTGFLEMGDMSSIASNGKIICTKEIIFGAYARLGSECQVIDTNFHEMVDTLTNQKYPVNAPIKIGNYNFISNRVTILSKTITPDYCTIASNSLCTKNYSLFGKNILIGGIPAKLIKENISRNWVEEKDILDEFLKN